VETPSEGVAKTLGGNAENLLRIKQFSKVRERK